MQSVRVGVLGSTSLVGDRLLPLLQESYSVVPFSRHTLAVPGANRGMQTNIPCWISLMPILALPNYFDVLSAYGAKRVVSLSSTSIFTKRTSSNLAEQTHVHRLLEGEQRFIVWAENQNIEWIILRPTLIYGRGRDRNVSEIVRFIRRFGFFPVFGPANGLRQPIHADDVASACRQVLDAKRLTRCSYNISGGETLNYREMVIRLFNALNKRPRVIAVPLWLFRVGVACARILPRYRDWSVAVVERMNQPMVFDHTSATRDFNFSPRPFLVDIKDLPS